MPDPHTCPCSAPAAPTSSASPATWKPAAAPAPPSPAGCAPSPGSTGTPSRKSSWTTHPPCTCAGRGWTTSPTPPALDRNELGALLVAAGLGPAAEHALISLLALNGLRVSEATGADIEAMGIERGPPDPGDHPQRRQGRHHPARPAHRPGDRPGRRRALRRTGVPRPRTAAGWTGTAPGGSSAGSPAGPGSPRTSGRTPCATRSSPPPWTPACRCGTCRKPPPTPTRGPPCATTGPGPPSTGTPPISSPPTLLEQLGSPAQRAAPPDQQGRARRPAPGGQLHSAHGRPHPRTAVRRSSSGLHDALAECSRSDIMGGCCATYCCATPFGTSVLSPRQDVVR